MSAYRCAASRHNNFRSLLKRTRVIHALPIRIGCISHTHAARRGGGHVSRPRAEQLHQDDLYCSRVGEPAVTRWPCPAAGARGAAATASRAAGARWRRGRTGDLVARAAHGGLAALPRRSFQPTAMPMARSTTITFSTVRCGSDSWRPQLAPLRRRRGRRRRRRRRWRSGCPPRSSAARASRGPAASAPTARRARSAARSRICRRTTIPGARIQRSRRPAAPLPPPPPPPRRPPQPPPGDSAAAGAEDPPLPPRRRRGGGRPGPSFRVRGRGAGRARAALLKAGVLAHRREGSASSERGAARALPHALARARLVAARWRCGAGWRPAQALLREVLAPPLVHHDELLGEGRAPRPRRPPPPPRAGRTSRSRRPPALLSSPAQYADTAASSWSLPAPSERIGCGAAAAATAPSRRQRSAADLVPHAQWPPACPCRSHHHPARPAPAPPGSHVPAKEAPRASRRLVGDQAGRGRRRRKSATTRSGVGGLNSWRRRLRTRGSVDAAARRRELALGEPHGSVSTLKAVVSLALPGDTIVGAAENDWANLQTSTAAL